MRRQINNESSKIYHYLRAGLPVVTESGFPNGKLVEQARLGHVTTSGDLALMAERIADTVRADWDRRQAVDFILAHHTWDRRVEVYDDLINKELN